MPRRASASMSIRPFVSHYQHRRPIPWAEVFERDQPLVVEIGSGLGEFLLRSALNEPERNFVGIELDWQRIKKSLQRISRCRTSASGNIRLMQVDARVAFERLFRPLSLERVECLFPCPWPKKDHEKRRLFSASFLGLVNSRLTSGGCLRVVTDYAPYAAWVREQLPGTGFVMTERLVPPQFDTKFERKWCEGGQTAFYELHLVKEGHQDIPLKEDAPVKAYFAKDFVPERFHFQDLTGPTAVVLKEFLFDPQRKKAMVHLIVAEPEITQHLWVTILHSAKGWCVVRAEGHTALPTPGVARALKMVHAAVAATADPENGLTEESRHECG